MDGIVVSLLLDMVHFAREDVSWLVSPPCDYLARRFAKDAPLIPKSSWKNRWLGRVLVNK